MPRIDALSPEKRALLAKILKEDGQRYNHFPTSYAQSRLWFVDQLNPGQPIYNIPCAIHFEGQLDVATLEHAFKQILQRHEALRTSFTAVGGEPYQVVHPEVAFEIEIQELAPTEENRDELIQRMSVEEGRRLFDLAKAPLMRAKLVRLTDREHVLIIVLHHIVADGWSLGVLFGELAELYTARATSRPPKLSPLPIQYKDFAVWQRGALKGERLDKLIEHWRTRLDGIGDLLELPSDRPRRRAERFRGRRRVEYLDPKLADAVRAFCKKEDATLFMVGLAVFDVLLARYTGQNDIVIGTPMANRTRMETEPLIGFFVNMAVIRTDTGGNPTFRELLARVRSEAMETFAHQDLPFDVLVQHVGASRDLSRHSIFQVVFAVQNVPAGHFALPGVNARAIEVDNRTAKFDLVVAGLDFEGGLRFAWEYNSDLFDDSTIDRLWQSFTAILRAVCEDATRPILELDMLGPSDRELVARWNRTEAPIDLENVVAEVRKRAKGRPDAPAFATMTYGELDTVTDRAAHRLAAAGAERGERVVVCLPRGPAMIAAQLAVMKTGAAFVSLDALQPRQRLAELIRASRSTAVICERARFDGSWTALADGLSDQTVFEWTELVQSSDALAPADISAEDIAYVIYTSGSTGRPKGVEITHVGLANLVAWYRREYHLSPADRLTQLGSPGFDLSILEIWPALAAGASLHFPDESTRADPPRLIRWMADRRITVTFLPTPLAESMLAEPWPSDTVLRHLNTGGDRLHRRAPEGLPFQVGNHYGPTEVSVVTSACPVPPGKEDRPPPIGAPIANTTVYVLDERRQPVPIGVAGELYIGGTGLARGYLGAPELTAEKFVDAPFGNGVRLYKSGDRVRFTAGGMLEFLGRIDHQVKIRGSRIELGEVEHALVEHASVREAIVTPWSSAGREGLVAYLVPELASDAPAAELTDEQIAKWQLLYEDNYGGQSVKSEDPRFNIIGWNSSYTGLPIPAEEMRAWTEDTVARIRELQPKNIFEIGFGTGLLLFRLIDHCSRYEGIDFSHAALVHVLAHLGDSQKSIVELAQKRADDLAHVRDRSADTVVLNSVAQYFPSANYLVDVLEKAVEKVADGGHVFAGDIRSLQLLDAFWSDVELSHASDDADLATVDRRVRARIARESELVIDPLFFHAFRARNSRVTRVEIQPKRGRYRNELDLFRYDVVLHVGSPLQTATPAKTIAWSAELDLPALIRSGDNIVVTGIPNARLTRALAARARIRSHDAGAAAHPHAGIDPEDLWSLADSTREVRVSWGRGDPNGAFDLIVSPRGAFVAAPEPDVRGLECERLTSYPLQSNVLRRLEMQLRDQLGKSLPRYMMPSSFVFLDALPATSNGKVDRAALPPPVMWGGRADSPLLAPRNPIEQAVADVWQQVLGTSELGVRDKFFDVGGDSLAMVRVYSLLNERYPNKIRVADLYDNPTIELVARLIAPPEETKVEQDIEIW